MSDPRMVLEEGVRTGLHPGAQLYVSRKAEVIFDYAWGEARSGVKMQTDSIVQWFSAGKPLTAIVLAQLYERGIINLQAPVTSYLPEFGQAGKESVTIA